MRFGDCECGGKLDAVWFIDEEIDKDYIKTGRIRDAVSHLVCRGCGKNHCVDDSFDKPWRWRQRTKMVSGAGE